MAWSPSQRGMLAIAGASGAVSVWDVASGATVVVGQHIQRALCVEWSRTASAVVFSGTLDCAAALRCARPHHALVAGGADVTLRAWNVPAQPWPERPLAAAAAKPPAALQAPTPPATAPSVAAAEPAAAAASAETALAADATDVRAVSKAKPAGEPATTKSSSAAAAAHKPPKQEARNAPAGSAASAPASAAVPLFPAVSGDSTEMGTEEAAGCLLIAERLYFSGGAGGSKLPAGICGDVSAALQAAHERAEAKAAAGTSSSGKAAAAADVLKYHTPFWAGQSTIWPRCGHRALSPHARCAQATWASL
jgi:hypothetical protein